MIAESKTKGTLNKSTRAKARTDIVRSRQLMGETIEPVGRPVDDTDAEAREIRDEIQQLRDDRLQDELQIRRIPITQLDRHPDNRKIDPKDPGIVELGQSIVAHGQLDPLRVRPMLSGRYQIISGERRFTAMQVAGVALARCVVVDLSDADALCEVAIANSNREDLNPIQRAELMQRLIEPREKGGSGLSLIDAGKRFGLNSESGCKNALRMLKLPPKIRELVISGQLPERVARRLIPYMVNDQIAKAIADDLTHEYCGDETMVALWQDELGWIEEAVKEFVRPLSPDVQHHYQYPKGSHSALFQWQNDSKLIEQLKIIELPWSIDYDAKARKDRVEQLAALAKVSAETAWRDGATDDTDQRRLISVWLCRHTKDQLHKLRDELHVTEGSSTMSRDELADCILRWHRPGKPLPLPKRLQQLASTK